MATASDLQQLYIGYFGRAADQEGLNFWVDAINNGGLSLDNVHTSFVQSAEYQAQYEGLTVAAKVAAVYENVLGRVADDEGLAFWTNAIEAGQITEDQLIEGLLSGLSANDAAIISNKVIVANYYTSAKGDAYTEASKAESGNILATVTGSTQSVADALDDVALVTGISNAELASALATLDAANEAQLAYAKAYLDSDTGTVAAANTAITSAQTTAAGNLNTEITAVGGAAIAPADAPAIVAQKIQLAQSAAAAAVTSAQQGVSAVVGLTSLVNTFNSQLATFTAASEAAATALTEQTAELAKFNVINGAAVTIAPDNSVPGVIVLNSDSTLSIDPAYAGNATQLAAANALLADIQARVAADKALVAANTALDATGVKIDAVSADAYDAATNTFTGGPVEDLRDALVQQEELAEAIEAFNEAAGPAAEWAGLGADITAATTAITNLGYALNPIDAATEAGVAGQEVFVVGNVDSDVTITTGDVLFVGAGYVLGTDSDDDISNGIQGGNNSALEVFIVDNAGVVEVHVETSAFGSSAVVPETTVIALTGVTSVDNVNFDAQTGLITFA
ncbi:DUF4214 domain-containing protein [Stutzerimonas stutzeri]|nr:DUF4214 domain-containing protein [Stutzerimonas stutzeri]